MNRLRGCLLMVATKAIVFITIVTIVALVGLAIEAGSK